MIIGLGTDIVSIERIAAVLAKNEASFINRVCTENEKKYLMERGDVQSRLAKIWAVKEAAVKALGTGFIQGVSFADIEMSHDKLGKPEIIFKGEALRILQDKLGGKKANVLVSLSDEKPFAQAIVIIEKI